MKLERSIALALVALAPLVAAVGLAGPSGTWAHGLDVSEHQGTIDWARARASGLSFAFIRVSDGTQHPDSEFATNWKNAAAAGVVRGAYQYFRPSEDPQAQADLLVSRMGSLQAGDLPPVIDFETLEGLASSTCSARIASWVARIQARLGVTPILYTTPGIWDGMASHPSLPGVPLWVAHWGVSSPRLPVGFGEWAFWQDEDHASVPGVPSSADDDWFHGSEADLRTFAASHGASGVPSGGGTATPPATVGSSHPTVRQGASGSAVSELQRDLAAKGYSPGAIDGIFGAQTRAAVVAFQKANGLAADGIVGPLTWAALTS